MTVDLLLEVAARLGGNGSTFTESRLTNELTVGSDSRLLHEQTVT